MQSRYVFAVPIAKFYHSYDWRGRENGAPALWLYAVLGRVTHTVSMVILRPNDRQMINYWNVISVSLSVPVMVLIKMFCTK